MVLEIINIILGLYLFIIGLKLNIDIFKLIGFLLVLFNILCIKNIVNKEISILLYIIIGYIFSIKIFNISYSFYNIHSMILKIYSLFLFLTSIFYISNYLNIHYFIFLLSNLIILFLLRKINDVHYDDLHPLLHKYINMNYLNQTKFIFVIPNYENVPITNYPKWCLDLKNYCKKHNKILCLHGINHTVKNGYLGDCEFLHNIDEDKLVYSINIFKKAFGFYPKYFKAPCYILNKKNEELIKKYNMKIFYPHTMIFNKLFHNDVNELKNINKFVNLY